MKWIVAYLVSISTSVASAVLLGFFTKHFNKEIAILSLAIGLMIGLISLKEKDKLSSGLEKKDFTIWSVLTITVFAIISLRAFLWLIFKDGDSVKVLSPNNLGDISLHISFVRYLTGGPTFWPDSNIYGGGKIHYPVGIDLFNSLLVLAGMDLFRSLIWVGFLSSFATAFALFIWGRAFTLAGFLFNGGLAGFVFLKSFIFSDYQTNLAWKSIFLSMFITQRGLLYALPAGLLLLSSWRARYFTDDAKNRKPLLPLWIEIILYSSMPIFHVHTFIFLSMLLGIWGTILILKKRFEILYLIICSFPLAAFYMWLLTDISTTSSLIHIKWGWMQGQENFLKFWILNFGIFLPLVVLLCLKLEGFIKIDSQNPINGLKENRMFVYPAIFLFILFCNLMMAPWDWDNCKLLIWSYLILLPYVWEVLLALWNKTVQHILCFLLFFSGFVSLIGGFPSHQGYEVFNFSEVSEVEKAVKNLPIENRFAAFPTYNHPLLYSGRKVVLGYPGWMWSHGYKTGERDEKLKKLMLGEEDWQNLAKELSVRYIFWGSREDKEYPTSSKPWESAANKIASGNWGAIYDLRNEKFTEFKFQKPD